MKNIEMLKYSLKHASQDAVVEVIQNLDRIWNQMYEESEQLERLDVVVDLEPEQCKRAADLESILSILCSMMNLCYDVLPKEDDMLYRPSDEYLEGCRNSVQKEGADHA